MVPFAPRLIPAILPNLAHHVSMIQSAAKYTNKLLFNVIQNLPSPLEPSPPRAPEKIPERAPSRLPRSPTPTTGVSTSKQPQAESAPEAANLPSLINRTRSTVAETSLIPRLSAPETPPPISVSNESRPQSPVSTSSQTGDAGNQTTTLEDTDLFDYQATVNELTVQFLSEYEETRVATLKWLIMLHQKAPKKVCLSLLILPRYQRFHRSLLWTMALSLHF